MTSSAQRIEGTSKYSLSCSDESTDIFIFSSRTWPVVSSIANFTSQVVILFCSILSLIINDYLYLRESIFMLIFVEQAWPEESMCVVFELRLAVISYFGNIE